MTTRIYLFIFFISSISIPNFPANQIVYAKAAVKGLCLREKVGEAEFDPKCACKKTKTCIEFDKQQFLPIFDELNSLKGAKLSKEESAFFKNMVGVMVDLSNGNDVEVKDLPQNSKEIGENSIKKIDQLKAYLAKNIKPIEEANPIQIEKIDFDPNSPERIQEVKNQLFESFFNLFPDQRNLTREMAENKIPFQNSQTSTSKGGTIIMAQNNGPQGFTLDQRQQDLQNQTKSGEKIYKLKGMIHSSEKTLWSIIGSAYLKKIDQLHPTFQ